MCGLVGVADFSSFGIGQILTKAFRDLLIMDAVRGIDGTGIFNIRASGNSRSLKCTGNPFNIIGTKEYEKITDRSQKGKLKVLAGHNRWATTGKISTNHSHPFNHEHIVLMHNGTLRNYEALPKKFDVDSEALAYALLTMPLENIIEKIEGAYALVYYNSKKKELNIARNSERPLSVAINETSHELLWASEPAMLLNALQRNNLNNFKINSIPPNKLYTFDVTTNKMEVKEKDLPFTGSKCFKIYTPYMQEYEERNWIETPKSAVPDSKVIPFEKKQPQSITGKISPIKDVDSLRGSDGNFYKRGDEITLTLEDFLPKDASRTNWTIVCKCDLFPENTIVRFSVEGTEIEVMQYYDPPYLIGKIAKIRELITSKGNNMVVILSSIEIPPQLNSQVS